MVEDELFAKRAPACHRHSPIPSHSLRRLVRIAQEVAKEMLPGRYRPPGLILRDRLRALCNPGTKNTDLKI